MSSLTKKKLSNKKENWKEIKKPRGTKDVLPNEAFIYQKIQQICQDVLNKSGYQPIILPTYEYADLFTSSLGEATDIVHKEMFIFPDRKGRNLALIPEGTASTVRLVCQNKLVSEGHPLRLYYWQQMFRYERPQKGRYRQFTQLGIELINAEGIMADGELLWLIKQLILAFDLPKTTTFHWNYFGSKEAQQKYKKLLKEYLKDKLAKLCLDCQRRYINNPLRILDCKVCRDWDFPSYREVLEPHDFNYIKQLNDFFDQLSINHKYNQQLVRGLDYYTGIVFEISLGENSNEVICGGGRYDQLFQQLGGVNLPAAGFALGIDRLIDFLPPKNLGINSINDILFLVLDISAYPLVTSWRAELNKKYKTVCNLEIGKVKNLFKSINHYLPRIAIIIGKKELEEKQILVRDCQERKDFFIQEEGLVNWVLGYLSKKN